MLTPRSATAPAPSSLTSHSLISPAMHPTLSTESRSCPCNSVKATTSTFTREIPAHPQRQEKKSARNLLEESQRRTSRMSWKDEIRAASHAPSPSQPPSPGIHSSSSSPPEPPSTGTSSAASDAISFTPNSDQDDSMAMRNSFSSISTPALCSADFGHVELDNCESGINASWFRRPLSSPSLPERAPQVSLILDLSMHHSPSSPSSSTCGNPEFAVIDQLADDLEFAIARVDYPGPGHAPTQNILAVRWSLIRLEYLSPPLLPMPVVMISEHGLSVRALPSNRNSDTDVSRIRCST